MNNETLTFCLTFESGVAAVLSAYARRLSFGLSTDYVLAPDALPHVTILKLSAPSVQSAQAWAQLEPRLPKRVNVQFSGLSLLPGKNGDVWVVLNVRRTAELDLLQEMSAKLLGEFKPRSAVGDLWVPHVTLLHSLDGRLPTEWGLDSKLITSEDVVSLPSLGVNRPPGRLESVLLTTGL